EGVRNLPSETPFLGGLVGDVHDLQLYPVGVVEEHGVVARLVAVLLRPALDLGAPLPQPGRALVDRAARPRLERDVMHADGVAVVASLRLRLAQPDRDAGTREVPDRLAALARHLLDAVVAERRQELAVEREAALDRRDDQVDVLDAHVSFATSARA